MYRCAIKTPLPAGTRVAHKLLRGEGEGSDTTLHSPTVQTSAPKLREHHASTKHSYHTQYSSHITLTTYIYKYRLDSNTNFKRRLYSPSSGLHDACTMLAADDRLPGIRLGCCCRNPGHKLEAEGRRETRNKKNMLACYSSTRKHSVVHATTISHCS